MKKRVHIVVASPSAIIRSGVVQVLKKMPSWSAEIDEISDMDNFYPQLRALSPDVLIVDVAHIGMQVSSSIRSEASLPGLKLVAFLLSMADSSTLRHYDQSISIYDPPHTIKDKISQVIGSENESPKQELSQREKEIIVCLVKGMSNKQIADILNLSTYTVMTHRRNIVSKLQIHSTAGLTIYAIVNKLVDIDQIKDTVYSEE